jgi:hypothetical protein
VDAAHQRFPRNAGVLAGWPAGVPACERATVPSSRQIIRHQLDRLLRRRKSQPQQRRNSHLLQSFQRNRQMRSTARPDHGVDLIDDDGSRGAQHFAASLGRE